MVFASSKYYRVLWYIKISKGYSRPLESIPIALRNVEASLLSLQISVPISFENIIPSSPSTIILKSPNVPYRFISSIFEKTFDIPSRSLFYFTFQKWKSILFADFCIYLSSLWPHSCTFLAGHSRQTYILSFCQSGHSFLWSCSNSGPTNAPLL